MPVQFQIKLCGVAPTEGAIAAKMLANVSIISLHNPYQVRAQHGYKNNEKQAADISLFSYSEALSRNSSNLNYRHIPELRFIFARLQSFCWCDDPYKF